jgi:hypothetical protein
MSKHIIPFWNIQTFLIILTLFHPKTKFIQIANVGPMYSPTNKQTNKQTTFTCGMEPCKVTQTKEKNY